MLVPTTKQRVEAQRTPITASDAKEAIGRAYEALTGQPLDAAGKNILTAQWAHETGHGASMYNYNFGGIKGTGPTGLSVLQRTTEGYGTGSRRIIDQFAAYGTVDEGAKDYVRLLLNRYGGAVSAAQRGDASGFVRGLKQKGYFTGDPAAYERSITSIAQRLGGIPERNDDAISNTRQAERTATEFPASRYLSSPDASLAVRALTSRIQGSPTWLEAPQPMALLDATSSDGPSNAELDDGTAGLSVARALSMADEITRSILEIAKEDEARRRTGSRVD